MSERERKATVGTKIPISKKRELEMVAKKKGLTISDLVRDAIYRQLGEAGGQSEEVVIMQLTDLAMDDLLRTCPLFSELKKRGKPRDARPIQEEVTRS